MNDPSAKKRLRLLSLGVLDRLYIVIIMLGLLQYLNNSSDVRWAK